MGAPIGDGPPPQTTGRERILPVMRYLIDRDATCAVARMRSVKIPEPLKTRPSIAPLWNPQEEVLGALIPRRRGVR